MKYFEFKYLNNITCICENVNYLYLCSHFLCIVHFQSSDSVSLDFLTYADLENLRQRKSGMAKSSIPANRSNASNSKCYLILTYTVEFDRFVYALQFRLYLESTIS